MCPSHQIIQSQEIRAESQSRSAEALVLGEVKEFQAELQDTLKALQQQQDPASLLDDDKVQKATCQFLLSAAFPFKTLKERYSQ